MDRQLALGFKPREKISLSTFIPGNNSQAITDLTTTAWGEGEPLIYLWGGKSTGKSHLLQAACELADSEERPAVYIPLQQAELFQPDILNDLESLKLICLDDLQQVAGDPAWEQAIFHLFNRLRDSGASLVVTADQGPSSLPVKLPDLASRLAWGLSYQLHPLSDDEKQSALIQGAERRGLEMSRETAFYILRHAPRDMGSLRVLLDRLDRASLEAQRRLTIPFVRSLIDSPSLSD